jgi:tight adherence protein B
LRRLALICSLVAVAGAVAAAATAAPPPPRLRLQEAGGASFPDRQLVVGLPNGQRVSPDRIRLFENGKAVAHLSAVPVATAGTHAFGVVLAIDASNSMRGRALAGARAAATAFVANRLPNQPIAVLYFNRRTVVAVPFTTDPKAVVDALERPMRTAPGTHIYDAASAAARLLRSSKFAAGSIVVLSDGSDTGSTTSAAAAANAVRRAHARIFSIGLRSKTFHPATLAGLASRTSGEYAETAAPKALAGIYRAIGTELAGQYLVRYRSTAPSGSRVEVTATVEGSSAYATTSYRAPSVAAAPAAGFKRSIGQQFWQSGVAVVVVALCVGLLAVVLAMTLRRRSGVRQRVSVFVTVADPDTAAPSDDTGLLTGRPRGARTLTLERSKAWASFEEQVELAALPLTASQLAVLAGVVTVLVALVAVGAAGPAGLLLALAVPVVVHAVVKAKLQRRRAQFAEQLPDNLQVIASALRAGHSLVGALAVLTEDVAEPSQTEFRRVLADEQLGVPLEDALAAVGRRMASRDLDQIAVVAALQRETGGNSAEVIDRVTETIRQRFELRRLVRTLTTQGRMSRWVVSLLPVVLFFVINLINPDYMRPLYQHQGGRVLIVVAALMISAGSYVIKRIVNIKV